MGWEERREEECFGDCVVEVLIMMHIHS